MKTLLIIALIFFAILAFCFVFYVYKKRLGKLITRISIYITVIGIFVAAAGILINIPETEYDSIADVKTTTEISEVTTKEITTEKGEFATEEHTQPATDSLTESDTEFTATSNVEHTESVDENLNETEINTSTTTETPEIEILQPTQQTPLKSLILKTSSKNYNISQTEFDPRGKMYTNVIYLFCSASNGIGFSGKLEFYTEKKYSTLKCTLVPQADFSTNNGAGSYIEIYKDDVLSYTSDLITYKTTAIDIDLDINGVEYLQIKIINVNPKHPYMANADILICDAYVN